MNPNDVDGELTRLFAEQRRADEASAPGFHELVARARARTKGRDIAGQTPEGRWAWRAALAAAASFALAVGISILRPPPAPSLPPDAVTIASWKAPSDVLLQTPGAELLGQVPVLLPVPPFPGGDAEPATPPSTQTKLPHTKGVES